MKNPRDINKECDPVEVDEESGGRSILKSTFKRSVPESLFFIFYFITGSFLTWPLVSDFSHTIYGFAGDNVGTIWIFWWYKNAGQFTSNASMCNLIGFPFGQHINMYPLEFLQDAIVRFLLLFLNEIVAYNLLIFASFLLSGITMYYLIRHITGNKPVAFIGGFAYIICTYHTFHSMSFVNLATTQWIPLAMLMLLRLIEKPSWKNTVFLSLSLLLTAGTCIHYGLFTVIFAVSFPVGYFAFSAFSSRKAKKTGSDGGFSLEGSVRRTVLMILVGVLAAVLIIVPFFSLYITNEGVQSDWAGLEMSGSGRTLYNIEAGAAQPQYYVIPNPGNFASGWITRKLAKKEIDPYQSSLYLSWVMLIFAGIAIFLYSRKRAGKQPETGGDGCPAETVDIYRYTGSQTRRGPVLWGFLASGFVAFILSLPPYLYIGDASIPLPSLILKYVVPWLRWYARFGVILVACVIAVACLGICYLIEKRSLRFQYFAAVLLIAAIFCDTALVPSFKYLTVGEPPEIYRQVEKLPDESSLVFYPAFEQGLFAAQRFLFYQRTFQKAMLNGAYEYSDGEALRRTVYNPYNPAVPSILSRFGITHVVYLAEAFENYEGAGVEGTDTEYLPPGLKKEYSFETDYVFSDGYIFEVQAEPAEVVPFYIGGITTPHINESLATVRFVTGDSAIRIENFSGESIKADIELPVANLELPIHLTVATEETVVWEGGLKELEQFYIRLTDLKIPEDGITLYMHPEGNMARIADQQISIYGTKTAFFKIGDVKIEPGKAL